MTHRVTDHLVRLLCDKRGIYGIGCEREAIFAAGHNEEVTLLLRPDRLETDPRRAALQMIIGGLRRGPFRDTLEDCFRQTIHHAMLGRAGLPWPPQAPAWWSHDPAQQKRNRQTYHGLRLASLAVINRLIAEALTVADQDALRQARRFCIRSRNRLYQHAAKSRRALQLVEAFPTLALAIYEPRFSAPSETIKELVEYGVSLRQIAEMMGIPWAFKKVKPAAAQFALQCRELDQSLVHAYLPDSLAHQKVWLRSVAYAACVSRGYAEWVARYTIDMGTTQQIVYLVMDIADWVKASMGGDRFVTRRFDPSMSLQTARKLSREWHEAIANDQDWAGAPFPEPWYPAKKIGDLEVVPIESRAELYREGHATHHCVGSYAERVHAGELFVFGIRRGGERLATIALNRTSEGPGLLQVRGPCNAPVSQQLMQATRKWLRSLPPLPPPLPSWMRPAIEVDVEPRHTAVLANAHQRGADARARGFSRRALPAEYCNAGRAREALAWIKGWDGEALTPIETDGTSSWHEAYRRGAEARMSRVARSAVPTEYRTPERKHEALAWVAGYEGKPFPEEQEIPF